MEKEHKDWAEKAIELAVTVLVIVLTLHTCTKSHKDSSQKEVGAQALKAKWPKSYTLSTNDPRVDICKHPRVLQVISVSQDEVILGCREANTGFLAQSAGYEGWFKFNLKTLKGEWHCTQNGGSWQGSLLLSNNSHGGYNVLVSYDRINTPTAPDHWNDKDRPDYFPPYVAELKSNW
jgi:hypothetical protein